MAQKLGALVILLGVLASGFFFSAGSKFGNSGEDLTRLRSRGGETVAEAYYQECGRYGIACSQLAYGLGIGILCASIGFGGLLMTRREKESPTTA